MPSHVIRCIETRDVRFPLPPAAGVDAIHSGSEYAFAVTRLMSESGIHGTGLALTLGEGNQLVCEAIRLLAAPLAGQEIEELMSTFGKMVNRLAEHPQLRWLGPHKCVVHLRWRQSSTPASICGLNRAAFRFGDCCWICPLSKWPRCSTSLISKIS